MPLFLFLIYKNNIYINEDNIRIFTSKRYKRKRE